MKAIYKYAGVLGMTLSVSLPVSAAMPGQGWDVFRAGASESGVGEPVAVDPGGYQGTSLGGQPGKGWDVFRSGAGEPVMVRKGGYQGTSLRGQPGKGWDVFRSGSGQALP